MLSLKNILFFFFLFFITTSSVFAQNPFDRPDTSTKWEEDANNYLDHLGNQLYGPGTRVEVNPANSRINVYFRFRIYAKTPAVADLAVEQLQEAIQEIWNRSGEYQQFLCYQVHFIIESIEIQMIPGNFSQDLFDSIVSSTRGSHHRILAVEVLGRNKNVSAYDSHINQNIWEDIYNSSYASSLPSGCGYYGNYLSFDSRCSNAIQQYYANTLNQSYLNRIKAYAAQGIIDEEGKGRPRTIVYFPQMGSKAVPALAHQIGHILGAEHIGSSNLMQDSSESFDDETETNVLTSNLGRIFQHMDLQCNWDIDFNGLEYGSRHETPSGQSCGFGENHDIKDYDWNETANLSVSFDGGYRLDDYDPESLILELSSQSSAMLVLTGLEYSEGTQRDSGGCSLPILSNGLYRLSVKVTDFGENIVHYRIGFEETLSNATEYVECTYTLSNQTYTQPSPFNGRHMQNALEKIFYNANGDDLIIAVNKTPEPEIEINNYLLYNIQFHRTFGLGESGMNYDCDLSEGRRYHCDASFVDCCDPSRDNCERGLFPTNLPLTTPVTDLNAQPGNFDNWFYMPLPFFEMQGQE